MFHLAKHNPIAHGRNFHPFRFPQATVKNIITLENIYHKRDVFHKGKENLIRVLLHNVSCHDVCILLLSNNDNAIRNTLSVLTWHAGAFALLGNVSK